MVYKLDDADKLCGVTYIDWSKKYSPIPKATCEMIKQQCGSGEGSDNTPELSCEDIKKLLKGGVSEDVPELSCEEIKKLLKGEDKPKEENPKGDKPKEDEKPKEENPSDNVGGNPPTEEKPTTDEVTPKENEPAPSPRVEETPAEPTPEPPVADTPREETPNEGGKEINLLELMPRVEGEFSKVTYDKGIVIYVTENSPKQKEDFENKIITTLRSKLPEGAVVEAVLGEPYYKAGSEISADKTNYTLNVRVTLNGKVYEQEYPVPNANTTLVGHADNI